MREKIGFLSLAVIIVSMALLAQYSAWNATEKTASFLAVSNSEIADVADPISSEADWIEIDRLFPNR